MSEFEATLLKLGKESEDLKAEQLALSQKGDMFTQKLQGFLKENGLPENFTLPDLMLLAIRKSRA